MNRDIDSKKTDNKFDIKNKNKKTGKGKPMRVDGDVGDNQEYTIYDVIGSYKDKLIDAKKNPSPAKNKTNIIRKTKNELISYLKDKYSGRNK